MFCCQTPNNSHCVAVRPLIILTVLFHTPQKFSLCCCQTPQYFSLCCCQTLPILLTMLLSDPQYILTVVLSDHQILLTVLLSDPPENNHCIAVRPPILLTVLLSDPQYPQYFCQTSQEVSDPEETWGNLQEE